MSIKVTAQEKEILAKVSIPPKPQALINITQEAKKPEPNINVIANAISEDPAISAAVLQVVNSAAYAQRNKVSSIKQAVMTLGIKRAFPLVKAVALRSALPENDDLKEFWQSSALVASACTMYSLLLKQPDLADNAYMLGLFHNAGIPIMLQTFDDYHDVLVKGINEGWQDINEIEVEKYHTSHTTLGALLAQQWQLPQVMIDVIYYFHDTQGIFVSGDLTKAGLYLLAILKLARSSVDGVLHGNADTEEWALVQKDIFELLNLDDEKLAKMRNLVEEKLLTET